MVDDSNDLVWRENHGLGRTTLIANDSGLVLEADRAGHYLAYWFAGLLAWALASAALPFVLGPVASTFLFLATPFVVARPFWNRSNKRAQRHLEEVAMELLRAAEDNSRDTNGDAPD